MSELTAAVTVDLDETEELLPEFPDTDVAEQEDIEEETTPTTVEEIVTLLTGKIETKEITAYGIHTVINNTFKILGIDIEIRPQMMYNYARNGMIVKGQKGTKTYNKNEVIEFAVKFVEKRVNK